ncbi:Origin of replication complex subunit 6 [Coemansia erecta]|uniref:Origin of replication complex subunit 6 n=1 Tax=Coemansia asiatica TaxID=1052880 RepID=A0A9W7XQ09_9FUNG|nr:Origin of replication complex subunit 6 [Coemansia asiatica]KAJ2856954.1 Origin of replication complex subunit 6 [Coemansia erecta]KAJ2878316.1 Origin of replication complex subunit 6 [Coemansia asiatica]
MNEILSKQLALLQLDGIPNLAPKAAQFFDQICRHVTNSKNRTLTLCRQTIAIQLACEVLSIEFNEAAASNLSAVAQRSYNTCAREVRIALGLKKDITLEELDVQVGPPPGVINAARTLLAELKTRIVATLSAAVSRTMNWGDSAYIASAFYVACKYMKKRVIAKTKLLEMASVKANVFNTAVSKIETTCKDTIKRIADGEFDVASKAPVRRRQTMAAITPLSQEESDDEIPRNSRQQRQQQNIAVQPASRLTTRGRRATLGPRQLAAATATVEMDEIGNVASRKRARRIIEPVGSSAIAETETKTAKASRSRPAQTATANKLMQSNTSKRARRCQPASTSTKTIAERAAEAVSKKFASKTERAALRQPRIGIISMIQDRDYRDTPLYSNYQSWRSSILASQ